MRLVAGMFGHIDLLSLLTGINSIVCWYHLYVAAFSVHAFFIYTYPKLSHQDEVAILVASLEMNIGHTDTRLPQVKHCLLPHDAVQRLPFAYLYSVNEARYLYDIYSISMPQRSRLCDRSIIGNC